MTRIVFRKRYYCKPRAAVLAFFLLCACPLFAAPPERTDRIRVQVSSLTQTTLSSEISAKISGMPFRPGDSFKAGQVLVHFDCSILAAQRNKAAAATDAARETYTVNKKLEKLGSVGSLELDQSEAKLREAQAELAAMNAIVSRCAMRAPYTGRVAKLHVENHQYVTPGKPIMDIVDTVRLEVRLLVPSVWLKWLKVGSSFTVEIDETGRTYKAIVKRVNPRVDPVSQTIALTGHISEKDSTNLLPGMSGWAKFEKPNE